MKVASTLIVLTMVSACLPVNRHQGQDRSCSTDARINSFDGTVLAANCHDGEAPAIVFIHGAFQSQIVWDVQVNGLAGRHRVITFDLRGHGESDRPEEDAAFAGEWTPARDVKAVLDHFGVDRAVLVGWSFGSIVAANAAAYLGSERIAGLVLVAGTIESNSDRNRSNFGGVRQAIAAELSNSGTDSESERARRFLTDTYHADAWDEQLLERILEVNLSYSAAELGRVTRRPAHKYAEAINRAGMPVLLIHGSTDNAFSANSSIAAHADLERSDLRLYEDTGHWPFLERVPRFNRDIVKFIETL